LEITPDIEALEQVVVEINVGALKSKEEAAFESLLKALNDLARE